MLVSLENRRPGAASVRCQLRDGVPRMGIRGAYSAPTGLVPAGTNLMLATRSEILAHVRTLRANIALARAALMNYKDDRLDRDKLEPAARRVDDLMDMYAGASRNVPRGLGWIAEIQSGIEAVTNDKAAVALSEAQAGVTALRAAMGVA
jgi:hypothetical protein